MPTVISVAWRIAEDRLEIVRLRGELQGWLSERRRLDDQKQFQTQLKALEDVLLKALAGVEAELAVAERTDGLAAVDVCRRVERATVWVRRVWTFFRWRFDQRDDPRTKKVLAAADEMVWSCYVEPFRALDGTVPPAPLPYIDDRFSPYAVPRLDPPPDLRFDVESSFIRSFLSQLPIPLIGLPPSSLEYPWTLALIAHEAGHHVQYDLLPSGALVGDFGTWLAGALGDGAPPELVARWTAWGREIFADAWSVVMIGPAALWALVDLEIGADERLLRSHPAYPSPMVRFSLMAGLLRELEVEAADGLRGLNPEALRIGPSLVRDDLDLRSLFVQDLDAARSVVAALKETPVIKGLTFADLGRWQKDHFVPYGTASGWTAAFAGVDDPAPVKTVKSARLATSGAVWAWANLSALKDDDRETSRKALRDSVIRTIAGCREPYTRASAPARDFAAADAGDKLCALVLHDAPDPGLT